MKTRSRTLLACDDDVLMVAVVELDSLAVRAVELVKLRLPIAGVAVPFALVAAGAPPPSRINGNRYANRQRTQDQDNPVGLPDGEFILPAGLILRNVPTALKWNGPGSR